MCNLWYLMKAWTNGYYLSGYQWLQNGPAMPLKWIDLKYNRIIEYHDIFAHKSFFYNLLISIVFIYTGMLLFFFYLPPTRKVYLITFQIIQDFRVIRLQSGRNGKKCINFIKM